jgi:hypothetical protein
MVYGGEEIMDVNELRYPIVVKLFEEYDFGDEVVKDRSGVSRVKPNTYEIIVFMDNREFTSRREVFSVNFKPDSTDVESVVRH